MKILLVVMIICVVVNQVTGENCVRDLTQVAINNLTSAVQELLAKSAVNCPTSGRDSRDTHSITEQMATEQPSSDSRDIHSITEQMATEQPSSESPDNERKCNIGLTESRRKQRK